jgi:pimeloyl-ACP methyl ester carboxylesterase
VHRLKALTAAALLAATGASAQRLAEARDRRTFPAPGTRMRVGDVDLHVVVQGRGPAVLIDSGLGGSSIEWSRVATDLEGEFTVIRYDRPGFAWSPGSDCDRRAIASAIRLTDLLHVLDVPGPAILVGHSLGGIHVRAAAALAPGMVCGLVLVDPSHEGMLGVIETSRAAAVTRGVLRAVAWSAPVGVGRLAGRAFARLALAERRQPLDPTGEQGARVSGRLTSRTVHGLRALSAEHAALAASLRQMAVLAEAHPALDVPVTVITASAPSDNARVVAARVEIDALHAQVVAAAPQGRHVFAERSGHLVPLDQPEIITQCVRDTAAAISAGAW